MLERNYQAGLIRRLKEALPGCIILKNDPNYLQGVPDLIILCGTRWAMLEVKRSMGASSQPNQGYYRRLFDNMSFAELICPENEEDVIHDLQLALKVPRGARVPQRQQAPLDRL